MLIIGVILSLTVLFKTEKIEVVGDKYYDEKQIIAFSGVEYQENIFMGAMYNTSDKIVKNLSYIESASVSFNIPDTITITVVDATPSYVIPNGNGYLLVSSKGRILEEISEIRTSFPNSPAATSRPKRLDSTCHLATQMFPIFSKMFRRALSTTRLRISQALMLPTRQT